MSPTPAATTDAVVGVDPWGHDTHAHDHAQFLLAHAGSARIVIRDDEYEITPRTGLWIPAGVPHSARFEADFAPFVHNEQPGQEFCCLDEPRTIRVDTQLRDAILCAAFRGASVGAVIEAALIRETPAVLNLARTPLTDPFTRAIGRSLRAHPADDSSLEEWARRLHTSSITIRRCFRRDTGASFSQWRTAVRIDVSADLLKRGATVSHAAQAVGLSHNGLLSAYRRQLGCTPSDLRSDPADD